MKVSVKGLRVRGQFEPEAEITVLFDGTFAEYDCVECGGVIGIGREIDHALWHVRLLGVWSPDSQVSTDEQ